MRAMWNDRVSLSTTVISAATASADLPVANVAHPHRGKVYRTGTSQAAEYIDFDLTTAMSVQCVVLLDHTLTGSDTSITLTGGATQGATTVNETLTYNADVIVKYLSAAQTYRWWRVSFTKSAAGETRDVGRVFLGPYDEYALAPAQPGGLSITPVDLSETDRALGGQTYSDIKDSYDEIQVDFPRAVAETQSDQLIALAESCGTHTPFFVSIDPTNKGYDWLYYVKAKSLTARKVNLMKGSTILWDASLKLAEEL